MDRSTDLSWGIVEFYQFGLAYANAASILKNGLDNFVTGEESHEINLGPLMLLIGQGYELLFKTVLMHYGVTKKELSTKAYGHDLLKLWDAVAEFENSSNQSRVNDSNASFRKWIKNEKLKHQMQALGSILNSVYEVQPMRVWRLTC